MGHRVANGIAESKGGKCDNRADNGEDDRIFSRRGTLFVPQHRSDYLQFAVYEPDVELMQFDARSIELPTAFARPIAAMAMTLPIIARISAYSAAEAPESSRSMLMKVFILLFLPQAPMPPRGHGFPAARGSEELN
jgi:hypothetical protein